MAGYPPPYPPPPGSYGYDPRQQRRMLRDQAKAQRSAYKAQRDFYKQQRRGAQMQARGLRRGSILGPLIVVALGILLLLIRMGRLPFAQFADWYGRWWPLLLVAGGLVLVLEWAFDKATESSDGPYVRRGGGGAVFLLLLVLGVTGIIVHVTNGRDRWMNHLNFNADDWTEFIGDRHETEQTIDRSFPAGTSLSIEDPHGDVTVTGKSGDDQIHLVANKTVYSDSDSDAEEKAQELSPDVQMSDGRMTVKVNARNGASVDLTVTVPDFAMTTVDSGHGDVTVSGLKAAVNLTANHGEVEATDIHGSVTAHLSHRDSSFSAHQVTGDVALKGNADDLNLTGIGGVVTLDGDFYGDTHLEHIGGATTFKTSRTAFSFAKLDGTVDISPEAELSGNGVIGPTVLTTRSRNIELQQVSGDVSITNSNGTVEVGSAVLGDVAVNNRSGSVTVTVPEGSGFNVEAETTEGEISNDFGFENRSTESRNRVSAKVGSGRSRVSISTTHGDVAVRKGSAAVEAAPVPAPAGAIPHGPAIKGEKHKGSTVTF